VVISLVPVAALICWPASFAWYRALEHAAFVAHGHIPGQGGHCGLELC
jgi:hypothetical protein